MGRGATGAQRPAPARRRRWWPVAPALYIPRVISQPLSTFLFTVLGSGEVEVLYLVPEDGGA